MLQWADINHKVAQDIILISFSISNNLQCGMLWIQEPNPTMLQLRWVERTKTVNIQMNNDPICLVQYIYRFNLSPNWLRDINTSPGQHWPFHIVWSVCYACKSFHDFFSYNPTFGCYKRTKANIEPQGINRMMKYKDRYSLHYIWNLLLSFGKQSD